MSVGWGQWWQVCSHVPQAMPVCGSGCQHWVGFPPGELCCTLSDWLGSCPSSDNVPGVDDTNATTLTTWFPSSLDVMMTPETMHCSCSAHAKMSLSSLEEPRGSQQ